MDYLKHFGLREAPFSTTPDPRFAYATREHEMALSKIGYYMDERRGLFLLTGEIGTGKTTISQLLLNTWRAEPDKYLVAHVTDPSTRTPASFLRLILGSYGQSTPRNMVDIKATLRGFLVDSYKDQRTVILLIDEAQTISPWNLDTLQYLSNEQSQSAKLIQIVLFAQPNFHTKLTHKAALRSRIAGGAVLNPLTLEDTLDMLRHRVDVAGGDFDAIFPAATHKAIYNATSGVPRDCCVLCDASMLSAVIAGSKQVGEEHITQALKDLSFKGWASK